MRIILVTACVIFLALGLRAQNSIDALRYSRVDYSGTARFSGMGGSFGALGGEISGLNINPAGIGIYRSSEFTFSAALGGINTETNYRDNLSNSNRFNFNIPNIAYVGSYKGEPNGWKNYSFAISYNRNNSFNTESSLSGENNSSTIVDDYVEILNNDNAFVSDVENYAYPFGASEAWQIIMIDTLRGSSNELEYVPFLFMPENIEQEREVLTSGNQSETSFTFGGNYQDRLYLGGSIGFQRIRYEREYVFREKYTYDPPAQTNEFLPTNYEENISLLALGSGINFKFGAIYRINDALRIGASIHSPSFFGINEEYSFSSNSEFSDRTTYDADGSITNYRYLLRTPARYQASFAYIYSNIASINFDYEYVDFSAAELNDANNFSFDYSEINQNINQSLGQTHNIRIGGELNFAPFAVRAGYRFEGNPYAQTLNTSSVDQSRNTYSIGGGYKSNNYNIDVALIRTNSSYADPVYNTSDAQAIVEEVTYNFIFTVGWRW